jgi:hypothetical protein
MGGISMSPVEPPPPASIVCYLNKEKKRKEFMRVCLCGVSQEKRNGESTSQPAKFDYAIPRVEGRFSGLRIPKPLFFALHNNQAVNKIVRLLCHFRTAYIGCIVPVRQAPCLRIPHLGVSQPCPERHRDCPKPQLYVCFFIFFKKLQK